MIPEIEILKILNHNGANRRYSKEQARLIHEFLKSIAESHVKNILTSKIPDNTENKKLNP